MPKFLENKLKRAYPGDPSAVYGTLNNLGYMHGNKETAKGKAAERKHDAKAGHPHKMTHASVHPGRNLGKFIHPRKSK